MNVFGATGARPAWDQEELAHALDHSSPWVQGMKSLFVWSEGEYPHNLINGRVATQNNPGYQHNAMNAYGAFGGYQGDWSIGPASEIYAASSTFMMLRRRRSSGAQSSSAFGDGGGLNVHMPWSDSNVYWDYPNSGSRVSYVSTPTSNPELWILTGGARGRDLVINGIKRTLSGNPTTTGSPSGTFKIGSGISPGEDMDIGLFASWGWQMPVDMAIELSHDLFGCLFGDSGLPAVAAVFAGIATSIGLATETDSAFGITWSKRRAVGLAAEADSALAAAARRTRTVGQPAEADSAFAIGRAKLRAAGLAAETDSAPAATPRRTRAVGLPSETDAALAVARRKAMAAGLAAETDTAPAVSSGTGHPIGQAAETDTAFAVTRIKLRLVGPAAETDAPLAIVVLKRRAVGLATETDAAPAVGRNKSRSIGLAAESDTAPAVGRAKAKAVGLAVETDSVLAFVIVSDVPAREQVMAAIAAELATITGIAGLTVARARTEDVLDTELPILVLFDDDERLGFEMTGERKAVLTIRVEGFAAGTTALAAQQAAGTLRAALDRLLADPDVMFSPSGKPIRGLRQLPEGRPARLRLAGADPAAAFVRRVDVEYATPVADPYTLI